MDVRILLYIDGASRKRNSAVMGRGHKSTGKRRRQQQQKKIKTGGVPYRKGGTDNWETPPEAYENLARFLAVPRGAKVVDPFYCHGKAGPLLRQHFPEARVSHRSNADFWKVDLRRHDAIITNPPFHDMSKYFARVVASGVPFAFLMPANRLETCWYQDMTRGVPHSVIVPYRPYHYLRDGKYVGRASFKSVWVVRDIPLRSDFGHEDGLVWHAQQSRSKR